MVQYNLFAYCGNSPVINIDPTGFGKTVVFYYYASEGTLDHFAEKSGYFSFYSSNVKRYCVYSAYQFVSAWNSLKGDIDTIYMYLHGDPGQLNFQKGKDILGFKKGDGYNKYYNFESLKKVKVNKGISLFSCYGGKGKSGNKEGCNVAWMFSKKIGGKPVLACTGGVSYYSLGGKYYARCSLNPQKRERWGHFCSFYYKKNKAMKKFYGWFA